MAKQLVTINGIVFSVHPKVLGSGDEKKTLGYSHLPVPPETIKTEDDYALWLASLVEVGVCTWKQIATGLYDLVLQQHGKILKAYNDLVEGKGFDLEQAMKLYADDAMKSGIMGWVAIRKYVEERWNTENRGDASSWVATEHSLYPKDVA